MDDTTDTTPGATGGEPAPSEPAPSEPAPSGDGTITAAGSGDPAAVPEPDAAPGGGASGRAGEGGAGYPELGGGATSPLTPYAPSGGAGRRGRRWLRWLAALLAAGLLVAGVAGIWVARQINPPGDPGDEVTVEIPLGSTTAAIGDLLEDAGVITNARVFRLYVRFRSDAGFQAGRYTFRQRESIPDVLDVLEDGPELTYDSVTVPEGYTLDQITERVGAVERLDAQLFAGLLASGEIRSTYQPAGVSLLEGLLFPDTYFLDENEGERELLERMVALLDVTAAELGYEESEATVGLTPYETLIVASLVEREARVPEDRAKISRVIHNRLARGMKLEIDATVLYALGEHKQRVLYSDLEVDSPYNTYRVTGLPPTPIAAPGRAAMDAALHPADGPWLYYVVIDEGGGHAFAETFAEHQANIREAQRRGVR